MRVLGPPHRRPGQPLRRFDRNRPRQPGPAVRGHRKWYLCLLQRRDVLGRDQRGAARRHGGVLHRRRSRRCGVRCDAVRHFQARGMSAQDPGSTGVAPRPPDSLEELYTEAQHALRAKEHERAAQLLPQILTADENFKDASRLLARLVRARRRRWYRDWRLAMMILAAGVGIWLWRATPRANLPPSPATPAPRARPP